MLASLTVAEFARAGMLLLRSREPAAMPRGAPLRPVRPHPRDGVDVAAIIAAHLFGVADVESAQDPYDAPPTTADFKLQGTLAMESPASGLAIVTAAGSGRVLKTGEEVDGLSLHAVYRDRVVLDRNGRLETLLLPRFGPAASGGQPARLTPATLGQDSRGAPPAPAAVAEGRHLAQFLHVEPSVDEESKRFLGFRIRSNGPVPLLRLGLRANDLLTAVNGQSVADQGPEGGGKLIDELLASSSATVSIVRVGRPMEIFVDLANVADRPPN